LTKTPQTIENVHFFLAKSVFESGLLPGFAAQKWPFFSKYSAAFRLFPKNFKTKVATVVKPAAKKKRANRS
jgi:hypothetical protein